MANRYPLVIDTTSGNNFAELPEGDNLLLTNSSIVNVLNISAVGNIAAQTLEVDGISVTGSYDDLTDKPSIPSALTDLGIADGDSGFILQANGDGTFQFVSRQSANVGDFVFVDNTVTVLENNLIVNSPADIVLDPTGDVLVSEATSIGFADGVNYSYLNAGTITQDRDFDFPDEDGTLATREWVNSQNFGTVIVDWTNIQNAPTTLVGYGITDAATSAQGALADTAVQPADNVSTLTNDAGYIDSTALTGLASETYVDTAVSNLVNSAPAALDTLDELAAALGDDPNFATSVTNTLGNKANTADLATVATSGLYSDLTGAPTVPSTLTDLGITDGTAGQYLQTDGAGGFSFASVSGGAGNAFVNITADTGTTTANDPADTLTVAGGTDIDTEVVGDTLTINFAGTIPTTLSTLTDVDLTAGGGTNANAGDVITYNAVSGNWEPTAPASGGATTLGTLTDVDLTAGGGTNANDGDGIFYNAVSGNWEPSAPASGGGASDLVSLTDTFIDKPADGQILVWNNTQSYWENQTPSAGTGLGSRQTFQVTTSSILNNSSANADISLTFPGYILYKVETDAAAWVRLYTDSTLRGIDSLRLIDEDPINVNGLVSEVVTVGAQTVKITPGVIGFNDESPVTNTLPISVTNLSGSTRTITVTVTVVQIEA